MAEIEAAEKDKMREKVQKILSHNINCFINRQLIYNFPEEIFADAGVMAIGEGWFNWEFGGSWVYDCFEIRAVGGEVHETYKGWAPPTFKHNSLNPDPIQTLNPKPCRARRL